MNIKELKERERLIKIYNKSVDVFILETIKKIAKDNDVTLMEIGKALNYNIVIAEIIDQIGFLRENQEDY